MASSGVTDLHLKESRKGECKHHHQVCSFSFSFVAFSSTLSWVECVYVVFILSVYLTNKDIQVIIIIVIIIIMKLRSYMSCRCRWCQFFRQSLSVDVFDQSAADSDVSHTTEPSHHHHHHQQHQQQQQQQQQQQKITELTITQNLPFSSLAVTIKPPSLMTAPWVAWLNTKTVYRRKMVTHLGTNPAWCSATWLMWTPTLQPSQTGAFYWRRGTKNVQKYDQLQRTESERKFYRQAEWKVENNVTHQKG